MDRARIASTVAEELFATEAAVEDALGQAVRLIRNMVDARRALGLPATVGDPALQRASAALNALGEAQREIVRAHGELETLRRDIGLRVTGFGPLIKPLAGGRKASRRTDPCR